MNKHFIIRLFSVVMITASVLYFAPPQWAVSQEITPSPRGLTASPQENNSVPGNFKPVSFTDYFGRKMTFDQPLEKIAVGHLYFAEYLVGIGAQDRIVMVVPQVVQKPLFFPELSKKPATPVVYQSPDYEAIIASGAQAYIMFGYQAFKSKYFEAIEKLEPAVKVICLRCKAQEELYATIDLFGRITGREKRALEYNQFQRKTLAFIQDRIKDIPDNNKVRVYFEPILPGSTVNNNCMGYGFQIPWAGGINIAGKDSRHDYEWFEVDKEWLVTQNPQVIVTRVPQKFPQGYAIDSFDGMKEHVLQTVARPELKNCDAVKNNRVYSISDDLIGTPHLFIGIAYMAKLFYPQRFRDLDPSALHQRYLDEFIRIKYDLDKRGTFVYPSDK